MRLRKPLAFAAVGALALTAAACGGSSGDSGGKSGEFQSEESAGSAKDASAKGPAPAVPNAVNGGTITVNLPADKTVSTLDPTAGWSVSGNAIEQDLVTRSLTTFRHDPKTGKMTLVPDLATDLGQHNKDFTEWTFTLKDGIKYDNGKPISANDIAYAIERGFDGNNGTDGAGIGASGPGSLYSVSYFLGGDKYNGPYDKSSKGTKYQGVTVAGNKITIKMAKPFPDMDFWGSFMAMGPVPHIPEATGPRYATKPWATGPYKVESFTPAKKLVLVKNTQWDQNSDPARHQYADKWIFNFDSDPTTTDQLMLSGNAQSQTALSTSLLSDNYADAKAKLGKRLVQGSSQCTRFLAFDMKKIPDIKVRQAIGYAFPWESHYSAAGDVVGVTQKAGQVIMPPGMAGRKEYHPVDGQDVKYDPEKSKQLLKEAGVDPSSITLSWVYTAGDKQAIAAKDQDVKAYEAVGFKTKPLPYNGSLYDVWQANPNGKDQASKLRAATNLEGSAWCADWPSALTFIPAVFQTGQSYNTGGFSEKAVDDKIKEIPSMPADQQPGAWADLDKEIMTKYYPDYIQGYINNLMPVGAKIGGFHNDSQVGAPDYRDLYVMK